MNQYNNSVKICTNSPKGEYTLSLSNTKQTIALTNNRAQYYAQLAEKYKEEAKEYRDNAQYFAEQNSDVTYEYINTIKSELIAKIDAKQNVGDYALRAELPTKNSELLNDSNYANIDDVISRDVEIFKEVNQGLDTKVDESSMVVISEASSEVISWCTPDYTAGISISFSALLAGYTAPVCGIFVMYIYPAGRVDQYLAVNDTNLSIRFNGPGNDADYVNATVALNIGDVIKMTGETSAPRTFEAKFYPLKGAK